MDFAIVRLEQVERFSGGKRKPVKVQYDGHYVRHGFAPIPDADAKGDAAQPKWNPMEVFLNLRSIVTSGMGDNGAQAAAIGRPASNIVAVSRTKGPLGADRFVKYETLGYDNPESQAAEAQTRTVTIDPTKDPETTVLFADEGWQHVQSLASYFDHRHELTATDYPAVEPQPAGPVDVLPSVPDPVGQVLKTLQVLQSYFSGEAKILGTVKIKYLLALLDLGDFLDAVPVLRETVEYGTAALAKVNDEAADLATDVRTRVIQPLLQVVGKLRAQWTALEAKLAAKVGQSPNSGLTLAKLYPEIETGLSDLERTLQAASSETDPVALAKDLAVLYESGRRFIRVLATIAANPVERLKDAATSAIDNLVTGFTGDFQSLADFKKQVVALVTTAQHLTVADLADLILANTDEDQLAEQLSLTFGEPDLAALASSLSDPLDPATRTFLVATAADLNKTLPTARDLVTLLVPHALNVLRGTETPENALRAAVDQWITDKKPAFDNAITTATNKIRAAAEIKVEAIRLAAWSLSMISPTVSPIGPWHFRARTPSADPPPHFLRRGQGNRRRGEHRRCQGRHRSRRCLRLGRIRLRHQHIAASVAKDYYGSNHQRQDTRQGRHRQDSDLVTKDVLARELEGCLKFRNGVSVTLPVKSTDLPSPLMEIAGALKGLDDAVTPIADFKAMLANLPPNVPAFADVPRFHADLTKLVENLTAETKKLYCATVQALSLLNEVKQWIAGATWTSFDRSALDQLTRIYARVDQSIKSIEAELVAIAQLISAFSSQPANRPISSAASCSEAAQRWWWTTARRAAPSAIPQRKCRRPEQRRKRSSRAPPPRRSASYSGSPMRFAVRLQIADDLQGRSMPSVRDCARPIASSATSADKLAAALKKLGDQLRIAATLGLVPAGGYQTVQQLLDAKISGLNMTVSDALAKPAAAAGKLEQFVGTARDAEADALSLWHLLQLKMEGVPDQLRQKLNSKSSQPGVRGIGERLQESARLAPERDREDLRDSAAVGAGEARTDCLAGVRQRLQCRGPEQRSQRSRQVQPIRRRGGISTRSIRWTRPSATRSPFLQQLGQRHGSPADDASMCATSRRRY